MKPKNSNPMPVSVPTQKAKNNKLLLIIVLSIVAAVGVAAGLYFIHQAKQNQAYQADKTRFAKVETDMKTAYDAMVANVGAPDVSSNTKSCGRPNLKYAKGHLSCGITYTYGYSENSIVDSRTRTIKSQQAIVGTGAFKLTSQDNAEDITIASESAQSHEFGFSNPNITNCGLVYYYSNPKQYPDFENLTSNRFSYYQFSCSDDVDKALF